MAEVLVAVQGLEYRASHSSVLLLPIQQAKHRSLRLGNSLQVSLSSALALLFSPHPLQQ